MKVDPHDSRELVRIKDPLGLGGPGSARDSLDKWI